MNPVTISGKNTYLTVLWIDPSVLILTPYITQDDGPSKRLLFWTFVFIFSLMSSIYLSRPLPIISWQFSQYIFCSSCAVFVKPLRSLDLFFNAIRRSDTSSNAFPSSAFCSIWHLFLSIKFKKSAFTDSSDSPLLRFSQSISN